jgi:20S proteasome subunit alpha 5
MRALKRRTIGMRARVLSVCLTLVTCRFTYDEPIGLEALTQSICDLALSFGEDGENESKMVSSLFGSIHLIDASTE